MTTPTQPDCCEAMRTMMAEIRWPVVAPCEGANIRLRADYEPIRYCPWCGTSVTSKESQ